MTDKTNTTADSSELQIARLSFIAATIVALGDGLAALASGLALQELEKSNATSSYQHYNQFHAPHKQIDHFIKELKQIKKTFPDERSRSS